MFGCTLIYLYLIYHIGRQVLQGYTRVATEKVLAIHQQAAYEASIHHDATTVELHARQLADKSVKHTALSQLELRGVEHQCVLACYHAYLRSLHGDLVE